MKKVYGKNCKRFKKIPVIILKNKVISDPYACLIDGFLYLDGLNKDHECAYYERKGWKFWVKQGG